MANLGENLEVAVGGSVVMGSGDSSPPTVIERFPDHPEGVEFANAPGRESALPPLATLIGHPLPETKAVGCTEIHRGR